jgi:hypothetical protein
LVLRLEIDDQLKLRGLYDRQVRWLGAAKNFTDIETYLAKSVGALSVTDQSTGFCKFANIVDRCNLVICRELYDPLARA